MRALQIARKQRLIAPLIIPPTTYIAPPILPPILPPIIPPILPPIEPLIDEP